MTRRRKSWLTTAALAVPVVLASGGLAACGDDSDSEGSKQDAGLASILTPRDDGLVTSGSADVRVRTSSQADDVRIYLDTKDVTRRFGSPRDGVRSAKLPVRRGENRLYVRARSKDGADDFDKAKFVSARRASGLVSVGQTGRGGPGPRVSTPRAPAHLDASLNGRPLKGLGSRGPTGLDADDGVRPGRNRLSVTAATADGRYQRVTRTFTAPRDRPVAGAGTAEVGQVGRPLKLDGSASQPRSPGEKLTYRWSVASAPPGAKPKLENADSARPSLVSDRNGRYSLQLQVSHPGGNGDSNDTIPVAIEPKIFPIGWRLETIPAAGGGIQLHGRVAKTKSGSSASGGNWVQLVVLDATTLDVKLARAFNTSQASDLASALNSTNLPQGQLAVLTGAGNRVSLSGSQLSTLQKAWKSLGGTFANVGNSKRSFGSGQWSIVGKPGLPEGAADQSFGIAAGEGQAPGGMNGLLQADSNNIYTFVADQYVPIDTGGGGSGGSNTIKVGSKIGGKTGETVQMYSSGQVSGAGFQLVALAAGPLSKRFERTYTTEDSSGKPNIGNIKALARDLKTQQDAGTLVVLQSIGKPRPRENTWVKTLTPAVAGVGGTTDVFNNLNGSGEYALVGSGGLIGGFGTEQSGPMTGKPGRISALLSRDPQSRMRANYSSPVGAGGLELLELAYGPGEPFPEWDAGEQVVYNRLGKLLNPPSGLKDPADVRANYWLIADGKQWTTIRGTLGAIKLEDINKDNTGPVTPNALDFKNVKDQLFKEFGWVADIRSWIGDVQTMYTDANNDNNYVNVESDANDLLTSLKASGGSEVSTVVLGSLSEALFVGSYFVGEEAAPFVGAVAGSLGVASEVTTLFGDSSGTPVSSEIRTEASKLGEQLNTRYVDTNRGLNRLGDILVSNFGKLKVAGPNVLNVWAFDTTERNAASNTIGRTTRRGIWKALMPIAYRGDILNPTKDFNPNPKHAPNYQCNGDNGSNKPYSGLGASGWENVQTNFKNGKRQSRLHAFGDIGEGPVSSNGTHVNYSFSVPSARVTDQLFSTDDASSTAVGFFKLEFFDRYVRPRQISCSNFNDPN